MSKPDDAIVADEYTPTTEQMREDWGALVVPVIAPPKSARAERLAEFDRWLAAHDREVAANTLRKFAQKVYNGAPATRGANFQAFYNDGLHPVLMAEADRIEMGASDGEQ